MKSSHPDRLWLKDFLCFFVMANARRAAATEAARSMEVRSGSRGAAWLWWQKVGLQRTPHCRSHPGQLPCAGRAAAEALGT